jgi:hypothetical protein
VTIVYLALAAALEVSGDFLMRAMHAHGFASIHTSQRAYDGLMLTDAFIAAAVSCAPPDNKPTTD